MSARVFCARTRRAADALDQWARWRDGLGGDVAYRGAHCEGDREAIVSPRASLLRVRQLSQVVCLFVCLFVYWFVCFASTRSYDGMGGICAGAKPLCRHFPLLTRCMCASAHFWHFFSLHVARKFLFHFHSWYRVMWDRGSDSGGESKEAKVC